MSQTTRGLRELPGRRRPVRFAPARTPHARSVSTAAADNVVHPRRACPPRMRRRNHVGSHCDPSPNHCPTCICHECLPQRRVCVLAPSVVAGRGDDSVSGVNPNFVWSAFQRAEAPNVLMPITSPSGPERTPPSRTSRACSTATRAVIAGREGRSHDTAPACRSKSSHDGMADDRGGAHAPRAVKLLVGPTRRATPRFRVPMRMTSGSPRGGSTSTYAAPAPTPVVPARSACGSERRHSPAGRGRAATWFRGGAA